MLWLKNETKILCEDELIDVIYSKKKLNEICSVITFDDGYYDNFELAYPILKKLKIPAIFFIPTEMINERKVGWWDIVSYLLKTTSKNDFIFNESKLNMSNLDYLKNKFISELKFLKTNDVELYLEKLSDALECPMPHKEIQDTELMTWEQIKTLSENGMNIGTHGHDHSICSRQSTTQLKTQLINSINILENKLDKKINSFSYPVGGYNHFNADTKNITKEVGLKLGFSYLTGINQQDEIDPYNVKRMYIKPEWINLDIPFAFPRIFLKSIAH